jgi:hypothetical protein
MGDYIELDETPIKLKIKLPQTSNDTVTFLLRNGEVITKTSDNEFAYEVGETGVYRVESYFNGKPWIFSNHIRIGKKGII